MGLYNTIGSFTAKFKSGSGSKLDKKQIMASEWVNTGTLLYLSENVKSYKLFGLWYSPPNTLLTADRNQQESVTCCLPPVEHCPWECDGLFFSNGELSPSRE